MIYGELINATLKKIDEYSTKGNVAPLDKTIDLRYKMPEATNEVLLDLARTTGKLETPYHIVHNPVGNQLSKDTSSIRSHTPGDDFTTIENGAKACYFECTGPATVYIEEETESNVWTVLESIEVLSTQKNFAEYKRLITPVDATTNIRLRFSGDYHYSFRNYILYTISFPTEEDIQQHGNYFLYDLPDDYMGIKNAMIRKDVRLWTTFSNYVLFPATRKIGFNSYQVGEYIINYYRKPNLIDVNNPLDETVIDAIEEGLPLVPVGVASRALLMDDVAISTVLWNQYETGKTSLISNQGVQAQPAKTLSGW